MGVIISISVIIISSKSHYFITETSNCELRRQTNGYVVSQPETMNREWIVESFPLTKLADDGRLQLHAHSADNNAVTWLRNVAIYH